MCWVTAQGWLASVHLHQHHTITVHISTSSELLVTNELRRHIRHGSHDNIALGTVCAPLIGTAFQFSGQPKIR